MEMQNSQLLLYHACLDAAMFLPEPVSQPQLNAVLIRVALVMASDHSSETLSKTPP